jgi:hypothetical protein
MTGDATEVARDAQKYILGSVEALQATVLQSARALGDIMEKIVPANLRGDVPGSDALPSAQDTVSLGFDFVEAVLASQRKFLEELTSIPLSGNTSAEASPGPKRAGNPR